MPVIGFLGSTSDDASRIAAFRQGLAQVGYVEGRSVAVEYRWAEGRSDPLPAMVSDLVHRLQMSPFDPKRTYLKEIFTGFRQ